MYQILNARIIHKSIVKEPKPNFNLRDKVQHFSTDFSVGLQKLSHKYLNSKIDDVEIVRDNDLKYRIYFTDKLYERYGINRLMNDLH